MAEPGGTEIQHVAPKPRLIDRVVGVLRGAAKTFEIDTSKTPADKINPGSIATIIDSRLWNPLKEEFKGNRFANGFEIKNLLSQMGHITEGDPSSKFPREFDAAQKGLFELTQRGILEALRDSEGRIVRYKVIDESKLKEIASKARAPK